jgi:hypothetical protein
VRPQEAQVSVGSVDVVTILATPFEDHALSLTFELSGHFEQKRKMVRLSEWLGSQEKNPSDSNPHSRQPRGSPCISKMATVHVPMVGDVLKADTVGTERFFPTLRHLSARLVEIVFR